MKPGDLVHWTGRPVAPSNEIWLDHFALVSTLETEDGPDWILVHWISPPRGKSIENKHNFEVLSEV